MATKLVLIDGNAIMHRAFHALPPLTTRSGEPINAVYGFITMLLKIIDELKPTHIVACFDRKEPTFRKKEFAQYQSHRPEMDEGLSSQFPKARQVAKAIGIPVKDKKGYEADDVIGTIANSSKVEEVVIVTGDKDIMQLVNGRIKLLMPQKGFSNTELVGRKKVVEKLGIHPEQVVDYKAMAGDPSDNYPGIKGIGHVTASKLLKKYKDLDTIYKNLHKLRPVVRSKFEEQKKNAEMSRRLAKIITDVEIKYKDQEASGWQVDSPAVIKLFEQYGFRTLTGRVKSAGKKIDAARQGSLF